MPESADYRLIDDSVGIVEFIDLPGDAEVPAMGAFDGFVKDLLEDQGPAVDIYEPSASTINLGENR